MKSEGIITESMRNNFRVLWLNHSTDGTIIDIFVTPHLIFTQIIGIKSQNFFLQINRQSSIMHYFLGQNFVNKANFSQ